MLIPSATQDSPSEMQLMMICHVIPLTSLSSPIWLQYISHFVYCQLVFLSV